MPVNAIKRPRKAAGGPWQAPGRPRASGRGLGVSGYQETASRRDGGGPGGRRGFFAVPKIPTRYNVGPRCPVPNPKVVIMSQAPNAPVVPSETVRAEPITAATLPRQCSRRRVGSLIFVLIFGASLLGAGALLGSGF